MQNRTWAALFPVCSGLAVLAAGFHLISMISPRIASIEYGPSYPMSRHAVFIVIDLAIAVFLLRRPGWFVWAYGLLTLQVLNSHGLGAWRLWGEQHRIDWISVGISIAAPGIFLMLVLDRLRKLEPQ